MADDFDAALRRDKLASAGVAAVIQTRKDAAVALVARSYDTSLQALRALLPMHQALDAGTPLDLAQLEQIVQQLQSLAAAIAPASSGAK